MSDRSQPERFVALKNRDCRFYLGAGMLAIMADNIEQYIYECMWF